METTEYRSNVLIVDDQEPMRLLLAHYVSQDLHAEVNVAGTCEEALHLVDRKTYDVILLDLLMPGIGGFEVLRHIRRNSIHNKATPVIIVSILVTSLGGEGAMGYDLAMELGVDAIIPKPVDRSALIAAINAALAKKPIHKECC